MPRSAAGGKSATGHDIIGIGGSAGALEALRQIVGDLPADFPASLFVTIHIPPYARSQLPSILSRTGPLRAVHPADRESIRPGAVYVAPPDHHLLVGDGFVRVVQGPKENNVRPAIDPLFRSAGVSYGPRAVGVLLSGMLDDGTAGLRALKRCGGLAVVQDPFDAIYPDMPTSALQNVPVDYRRPAGDIGPLLTRLAAEAPAAQPGGHAVPDELRFEAAMAEWDHEALRGKDRPGRPSPFVCPNCRGDLWEIHEDGQFRFRCRTGHAWSPLTLLAGQSEALDETLNEAFRALKEKAHLTQRLAHRTRHDGNAEAAAHYDHEAKTLERYSRTLWELLLDFQSANPPEAPDRAQTPTETGNGPPNGLLGGKGTKPA